MNHTTKRIIVAVVLAILCLVLVSCGGVDSIYFDKKPRTTYVQGQDIVLDDATLLALKGDESQPVNVSEVEISGYDANVLGTQEVTFTYKNQSVSLTVKVIPRISVEGATTSYFIRDTFDKTKGRIKVADDEGKITTVNMSDDAVTIEGFDSSMAGKGKSVTVKYGDYSGTFTVDVYNPDTVELSSKPKKILYYSHETVFSTSGAYFTVTAEGGAFSRMVELTSDMIKGFNPSEATIENLDSPMKQIVTIFYLDHEEPFEISVRYSGISLMRMLGEELKDVAPEAATKEQGEAAIFAMGKYDDLSKAEREEIDEEIVNKLISIAVTYGSTAFESALDTFSETFELRSEYDKEAKRYVAGFTLTAKAYETVVTDLERLKDSTEPFITLADSLRVIKDGFHDVKIGDKTVDELLGKIYSTDSYNEVIDILELMVELHETLDVVPDDWTVEMLPDYKDDIIAAVVCASSSDFGAFTGYDAIYSIVSSWRGEKDDYFDIIYAYYLEYERDSLVDTLWQKVMLPGKLQQLYNLISYALSATQSLKVGVDTTAFMYYYREAYTLAKEIRESDNQLHVDIYKYVNFDVLINNYLFIGSAEGVNRIAYVYHTSSLLDNPSYDALLEKYLELLDASLYEEFSFASEQSLTLANEILTIYMDFTPAERFAFLCSLYCDYRFSITDDLALGHDINEDGEIVSYSYFVSLILKVYRENLSDDAFDVFARLLEATEMYALRNHNPKHFDGFTDDKDVVHKGFAETMEEIIGKMNSLSDDEKAIIAVLYDKLFVLYSECSAPTTPELTDEEKAKFDELKAAIEVFFDLYTYADSEEVASPDKGRYFILAFAAYERAKVLAGEIVAAGDDVLHTYLYVPYTFNRFFELEDGTTTVDRTFDHMIDEMGGMFYLLMLNMEAATGPEDDPAVYNAFYIYYVSGMGKFLEEVYDIMMAEYNGTTDELAVEDVVASLVAYSKLEEDPIFGMYILSATPTYFAGVVHSLSTLFDEATMTVIDAMIYAHECYAAYVISLEDEVARQSFVDAIDALNKAYDALEDKSAFDESFTEVYSSCIDKFNNLPEENGEGEDNGEGGTTVTPTPDSGDESVE